MPKAQPPPPPRTISLIGNDGQELRVSLYHSGQMRLEIDDHRWGVRDIRLQESASAALRVFCAGRAVTVAA